MKNYEESDLEVNSLFYNINLKLLILYLDNLDL